MKLTESKLRRIIRSVIFESNLDESDPYKSESVTNLLGRLGAGFNFNPETRQFSNEFAQFYSFVHGKPYDSRIAKTHGWGARGALFSNAIFNGFSFGGQQRLDRILDRYIEKKYRNSERNFYYDLLQFHGDGEPMGIRDASDREFLNVMRHLVTTFIKNSAESSRKRGYGIEGVREMENSTLTVSFLKKFVHTLERKLDKIMQDSKEDY